MLNRPKNFLVTPPRGNKKFPTPLVNQKTDIAFYPFYPSRGVSDRGSKLNIAGKIFNSIISGNEEIEMRWLDSEAPLSVLPNGAETPDELQFFRNVKLGVEIYGRTTSGEYSSVYSEKIVEKTNVSGENFTFTEKEIQESRTVFTKSRFFFAEDERENFSRAIDKNKVRLYFMSPELTNSNELWFIDTISVFLDNRHEYLYSEIRFMSLGERIKATGQIYDIVVKLGAAGDFIPLPKRGYKRFLPPILDDDGNPTYRTSEADDEADDADPDPSLQIFKEDIRYPLFDYKEDDTDNLYFDGSDSREIIKTTYLRGNPQFIGAGIVDPVVSYQLEVDSGAPFHSILFWGRKIETEAFPSPARTEPARTETVADPDNEGETIERVIPEKSFAAGEEYVIPSFLRVNRPKLIFSAESEVLDRDSFLGNYQIALSTFTGRLTHETWTTDWKNENQLELNRDKTRFAAPIFRVKTVNNQASGKYESSDFRVGSEEKTEVSLFGKHRFANSKWSTFLENWVQASENGAETVNGQTIIAAAENETEDEKQTRLWNNEQKTNKIQESMRFTTMVNTNAILTLGEEFLSAGGIYTTTTRDYWSNIADTVGKLGGAVIGAVVSVGGAATSEAGSPVSGKLISAAAGAFVAKMIKDIIFYWLPEKNFIKEKSWKESTSYTYLAPKSMLDLIWNKQPNSNKDRIPLQYFLGANKDNLSGRVNAAAFKYLIAGKLTDEIKQKNDAGGFDTWNTRSFDSGGEIVKDSGNIEKIDLKDKPVIGVPLVTNHPGFIIDRFEVKVVGETNLTLKLFNKRRQLINKIGIKTTSNYVGNIQHFSTTQLLSDFGISETVFEDPALDFEDFTREEQPVLNQTWKDASDRAKAELRALDEIELVVPSDFGSRKIYDRIDPAESVWSNFLEHRNPVNAPALLAENTNYGQQINLTIPENIKQKLRLAFSSRLNDNSPEGDYFKVLRDGSFSVDGAALFGKIEIKDEYFFSLEFRNDSGWQTVWKRDSLVEPLDDFSNSGGLSIYFAKRFSPYNTTQNDSRKITVPFYSHNIENIGSDRSPVKKYTYFNHQFDFYYGLLFPANEDSKQWYMSSMGDEGVSIKMRVSSTEQNILSNWRIEVSDGVEVPENDVEGFFFRMPTREGFQALLQKTFRIRNQRFSGYIKSAKLKKWVY